MKTKISIIVKGMPSSYEVEHLARVFFPFAEILGPGHKTTRGSLVYARVGKRRMAAGFRDKDGGIVRVCQRPLQEEEIKPVLSRLLYDLLCEQTGQRPPWGLLTGVRPVRLLRRYTSWQGEAGAKETFLEKFGVSEPKYQLAKQIVQAQAPIVEEIEKRDYSLYVSIPFCPTRCSYCSFVSQSVERESGLMQPYLEMLFGELRSIGVLARELGLNLKTVYIGGGTPTALTAEQLEKLFSAIAEYFPVDKADEYTVEAGRPDSTDFEKLKLMRAFGVNRISINPQSMSEKVLKAIGRKHSAEDVVRCMEDARKAGHDCINMDLIAGLPEDTLDSFAASLQEVLAMQPENITVHALTVKRGSSLSNSGVFKSEDTQNMLEHAYAELSKNQFSPYYLYRQKNTPGNLENTGWTKKGCEGRYNVYIMEEVQSIISVGAGAVTKLVADKSALIQRVYTEKYPLEYMRHFEKALSRTQKVREFYASILDT